MNNLNALNQGAVSTSPESSAVTAIKKQIDASAMITECHRSYDSLNQLIIQHDLSDKRIIGDASTATWNIGCGTNWVDKVPELKDASSTPQNSLRPRGNSSKENKVSPFNETERLNLCAYIIERLLHRVDAVLVQEGPSRAYLQEFKISEDKVCSLFGVPANGEGRQIRCWTKAKDGVDLIKTVKKNDPGVVPESPVGIILEAAKNASLDEKEYQITTSGSKIYVNIHFDWTKMYDNKNSQKSELPGLLDRINFLKNIQQYADVIAGDTNIEATVVDGKITSDPIGLVRGLHVANGGCNTLDLFCSKESRCAELLMVNRSYYSQQPAANIDDKCSEQIIIEWVEDEINKQTKTGWEVGGIFGTYTRYTDDKSNKIPQGVWMMLNAINAIKRDGATPAKAVEQIRNIANDRQGLRWMSAITMLFSYRSDSTKEFYAKIYKKISADLAPKNPSVMTRL